MAKRPTYEELERIIKKYKKESTQRKRLERALGGCEERYRTFLEAAGRLGLAVLLLQDRDGVEGSCVFANETAAYVTGYTVGELKGVSWLDIIHPLHRDSIRERYRKIMGGETVPDVCEIKILSKNGTEVDIELTSIKNEFQGRGSLTAFFRDITGRKELEQRLLQSQRMETIGRLTSGVAHDFNNLLTAIIGESDLMLRYEKIGHPFLEKVKEIKKAAGRAASLTHQLLAFSRKQILEPKVLDLNGVIAEAEKLLKRLIGEDVELVTILEPELGRVKIDPGQMEQVIMNLAVNARDAMPQGGRLTIETGNVDLEEDYPRQDFVVEAGPYVMLVVSDTGAGMDKETRSKAFEPFFTTKPEAEGTGLGLATVYEIVKEGGGYLWLCSEPGQGTTFKVFFPRVDETLEPVKKGHRAIDLIRGSETVLVVEDNEMVRKLTRRILEQCGYRVVEAANGKEALRVAGRHNSQIHLMVTDVVMPGMSGKELADHMVPLRPETKILFMSGYTDATIIRHGISNTEGSFIQKPFTAEKLAGRVRKALGD